MRQISFALTTPQFIAGTKTVTRRNGWIKLKAGDRLMAVEKGMGLKRGEKVKKLGVIEVVSVKRETLKDIYHEHEGAKREGFPDWTEWAFIEFYCKVNKVLPGSPVTRIEFKKVAG